MEGLQWSELFAESAYSAQMKLISLYKEGKLADFEQGLAVLEQYLIADEQEQALDLFTQIISLVLLWHQTDSNISAEELTELEILRDDLRYNLARVDCISENFLLSHIETCADEAALLLSERLNRSVEPKIFSWPELVENEYELIIPEQKRNG